jgi:hypothetical protein
MKQKLRRYLYELGGSLALYMALVVGCKVLLQAMSPDGAMRYAVALLPMLGVAGCAWAILRHVRQMDEMQRRVELESLSFAFSITAFGSMAWAFAETAGAPKLPTFAIWPVMAGLWVLGGLISRRHYR